MKIAESCRAFNKAYTILRNIDSMEDLKKHKLTLAEYRAVQEVLTELSTPGSSTKTFISGVADFFERCGFTVKLGTINYTISS